MVVYEWLNSHKFDILASIIIAILFVLIILLIVNCGKNGFFPNKIPPRFRKQYCWGPGCLRMYANGRILGRQKIDESNKIYSNGRMLNIPYPSGYYGKFII